VALDKERRAPCRRRDDATVAKYKDDDAEDKDECDERKYGSGWNRRRVEAQVGRDPRLLRRRLPGERAQEH
jgi:hypothetical protein